MSRNYFQLIFLMMISASLGGFISLFAYHFITSPPKYSSIEDRQKLQRPDLADTNVVVPDGLNFLYAAQLVRPAVVHIKSTYGKRTSFDGRQEFEDMLRQFHDGDGFTRNPPKQSTGSGVIISDDGYIVTNHHVIDEAGTIEVVLNDKRSYKANIVGTDPTTDLALLKIDAQNLNFVYYGSSKTVQIGEWVLAVGNPFDLTSTVTAGIVSAKGRSINLLKDQYAIESFIQTDAAVNPGNSGGALVNLKGELVGVNTAIATQTGYYAGYSFAIPINIVKKVMDDLMQYGEVKRAILGVTIREVDAQLAEEKGLNAIKGVYIIAVTKDGAAKRAGIKAGDIIYEIDGIQVNSASELQTIIATHRPGDQINIVYIRKGKKIEANIRLRNTLGSLELVSHKTTRQRTKILGAELEEVTFEEKKSLGIENGIKVRRITPGKIKATGIKEGFIITRADDNPINSAQEFASILKNKNQTVAVDGVYPNGKKDYYALTW